MTCTVENNITRKTVLNYMRSRIALCFCRVIWHASVSINHRITAYAVSRNKKNRI